MKLQICAFIHIKVFEYTSVYVHSLSSTEIHLLKVT